MVVDMAWVDAVEMRKERVDHLRVLGDAGGPPHEDSEAHVCGPNASISIGTISTNISAASSSSIQRTEQLEGEIEANRRNHRDERTSLNKRSASTCDSFVSKKRRRNKLRSVIGKRSVTATCVMKSNE